MPVNSVFVKIKIELGTVLGNVKLLLGLISKLKPSLAAFVAVTTQFVFVLELKTLVAESIVQPTPDTEKVTAPEPDPPEELKTNLIEDEPM